MSTLFGALGITDSERPFTSVEGRQLIWDATQQVFQQWNTDLNDATRLFVQGTTENHAERYELPGGGESQEEAFEGSETAEVNRTGSWDVAYPLWQFGDSMSWTEVALGYLTLGQYEAVVQTIINRNNNNVFRKILKALFKNTTTAYTDRIAGSLTLQPLANGDAVVYPPVYGATAEATENFYLAPNYNESGISNTNNPFVTIRSSLEPHYGYRQGGSPIVVLVAPSAVSYIRDLADFDSFPFYNVAPGDNTAIAIAVEPGLIPTNARIVGGVLGCTVVEWPRMPAGWMIAIHADAPKPVMRRVDPAYTGLTSGLQLLGQDGYHPFTKARWRHRFGYAVGNRLGAVAVALNGTSSYSIPTGYS